MAMVVLAGMTVLLVVFLAACLRWPRVGLTLLAIVTLEGALLAWWETRLAPLQPIELTLVPEIDQGIDFAHPVAGREVYLLVQMSTGRPIVERGTPILMDKGGHRIAGP